jgi:predicted ABC-type ATPase
MVGILTLVCGCNGAGKSTFTKWIGTHPGVLTIDPDKIARDENCSAIMAGRIISSRVNAYIAAGKSFVKESTLTSHFDFKVIEMAKDKEFNTRLVYVGVASPNLAIFRVNERVRRGGHFVPEKDVRRRYVVSIENLAKAIPVFDEVRIFDNTEKYRHVASFQNGNIISYAYKPEWFASIHDALALKESELQHQMSNRHTRRTHHDQS